MFKNWLIENYYSDRASKDIARRITIFKTWLKEERLSLKSLNYSKLLDYIGELQQQKKSKAEINKTLRSIELFYDYLNDTSKDEKLANVALNVRLRGVQTHQTILLTEKELLMIYNDFRNPSEHSYLKYSNKLILGLIIFQALDKKEILFLQLKDINLEKGTIYIRSGARTKNSRTIPLEAYQIIPLQHYITHHRGIGKNFVSIEEESERLFHPNCDVESRLQDQLKQIAAAIKTDFLSIQFKRLTQLKQSRICLWIEKHVLRKTQYLAGHKDIGSIQKYQNKDLKNLSKQIEMFHPLN